MNRLAIVNMSLREYGEATSPVHFGGTVVVNAWFNDVKREFEVETRINYGTVGTTYTANERVHAIATSLFHPVKARYRSTYLTKTTMEELQDREAGSKWIAQTGVPSSWYIAENFNRIGLYPIPAAGYGGTLKAEGYKTTADITSDTAVPSFPPQFHRALVDGLGRRFAEEDSDNARGQLTWARANARYLKYVGLASREGWPSKPRIVVHPSWT